VVFFNIYFSTKVLTNVLFNKEQKCSFSTFNYTLNETLPTLQWRVTSDHTSYLNMTCMAIT